MSFNNDFTLSSIQYVAVIFKRKSVRSQQTKDVFLGYFCRGIS